MTVFSLRLDILLIVLFLCLSLGDCAARADPERVPTLTKVFFFAFLVDGVDE